MVPFFSWSFYRAIPLLDLISVESNIITLTNVGTSKSLITLRSDIYLVWTKLSSGATQGAYGRGLLASTGYTYTGQGNTDLGFSDDIFNLAPNDLQDNVHTYFPWEVGNCLIKTYIPQWITREYCRKQVKTNVSNEHTYVEHNVPLFITI